MDFARGDDRALAGRQAKNISARVDARFRFIHLYFHFIFDVPDFIFLDVMELSITSIVWLTCDESLLFIGLSLMHVIFMYLLIGRIDGQC